LRCGIHREACMREEHQGNCTTMPFRAEVRPAGERRAAPVRWEPDGVVERALTAVLPHSDSLFNADKRRAS
ncbi:unnamed protein product, partial [Gadus morhua 'NCC']